MKFIHELEEALNVKWDNPQKLKLVIHVGCALERMVVKQSLIYDENSAGTVDEQKFTVAKKTAEIFNNTLRIKLTDDELKYISAMI